MERDARGAAATSVSETAPTRRGASLPTAQPPHSAGRLDVCVRILGVVFLLYLFLVSIKAMGGGLKVYAEEDANQILIQKLFNFADNPFVALAAGIFVTSVVQSSSFTTSFIIALVAAGQLQPAQAVPAIMGANIGTSVTNTLVSLAHWRSRGEFRKAFSAATVHDIFNGLTVLVVLPLEMLWGVLSKLSGWSAAVFDLPADLKIGKGFVSAITKPVIDLFRQFLSQSLNLERNAVGLLLAIVGIVLLFVSLVMLVRMLKGLMLGRLESLFRRFVFSNTGVALVVGLLVTIVVQSSSVTTSLIIPFVGAGLLTMRQVFPYMVGANIGTTCTGLLAAAAAPTAGSLMVAFAHLWFNIAGASIFVPLRRVPITLARRLARWVARNRYLALVYVGGVFIVAPAVCIYVFSLFASRSSMM